MKLREEFEKETGWRDEGDNTYYHIDAEELSDESEYKDSYFEWLEKRIENQQKEIENLIETKEQKQLEIELWQKRSREFEKEIEELKKEWISVEDKKPETGIEVLGYNQLWIHEDSNPDGLRVCFQNEDENGPYHSAHWCSYHDEYHSEYGHKITHVPTHWMPLPEPPNH